MIRDATRTVIRDLVPEGGSFDYAATLLKPDGTALGSGEPGLTLTLTLYNDDDAEHTVLNALDEENILNASRGTLDTEGHLLIALQSDDLLMLSETASREKHVMLIEATWDSGDQALRHEVEHTIRRVVRAHLPAVP